MTVTTKAKETPLGRAQPLDRVLRLFADVREGEGATALLLALNVLVFIAEIGGVVTVEVRP